MKEFDIYKRCEDFILDIIQMIESIPYRKSVGIIGDQLMRASGSVGANLNEANNARSKKEFTSCIGISLKEVKESIFWLKVLTRTNLGVTDKILSLESEANEIKKILGRIYWSSQK